jgi:hypothetical protein
MVSPLQRLRSLRHAFWFRVSERLRWSRGIHRETPAGLLELGGDEGRRIGELRERYGTRFESRLSARTARNNYEYLEILDAGWRTAGLARPSGGTLVDVGCASFWYASALHAFFDPARLIGVDVEGHRLFRDGHTRIDYARGYVGDISGAEFLVADYTRLEVPAGLITAWFPFVTPAAILAWRLPLRLLAPESLFARIRHNLTPGGLFFMVNHGAREADAAAGCCLAAGLELVARHPLEWVLGRRRPAPPMLSWWRR